METNTDFLLESENWNISCRINKQGWHSHPGLQRSSVSSRAKGTHWAPQAAPRVENMHTVLETQAEAALTRVRKIPWKRAWQPTPIFLSEESRDREAWRATVQRVTKGQTLLKWLSTHPRALRKGLKTCYPTATRTAATPYYKPQGSSGCKKTQNSDLE